MLRTLVLATVLLILGLNFASAQDFPSGGCGTSLRPEDVGRMQAQRERRESPLDRRAPTWRFVPMVFHIVRNGNGNFGLDPDDLPDILSTLNADFSPMKIVFYNAAPVTFIDDDNFYDGMTTRTEIDDLRAVDNVDRAIDVYFVKEFSDENGGLCGLSSFSFRADPHGIVMDKDCTVTHGNASTFTHEVGHYFDLLHTHETASGAECVDGSNCSFAGDGVCDTPADPELGSSNVNNCSYVGSDRDDCNNALYAPRVDNFMSYAPSSCRVDFTAGQQDLVLASIEGPRADHVTAEASSSNAMYVDHRNGGVENGGSFDPYDTPAEAIQWAQIAGAKLVILAGGDYPDPFMASGFLGAVTLQPTAGTRVTLGN